MESRIKYIKNRIVNQPLYAEELARIIQYQFEDLGVEVNVAKVEGFPKDTATVNGYFNSFDWDIHENIELVLIVNDDEEPITINNSSWNFLKHQINQTLEHEMIHREQVIIRDGLTVLPIYQEGMCEEQERIIYLSDPDEIGAYANDVALDLLETYTCHGASARLVNYITITKDESPILCEYMDLFGPKSDIVKTIVKKAMKRVVS